MQLFGRSEVKASLKEVPGQLTSLCKSEGPGPAVGPETFQTRAKHPVSSLPPPFPKLSAFPGSEPGDMKLLTFLHNQVGLFLVCCDGS